MAEEFIIKSPDIESKINQLLPSQGGFQAGVDFSASTMVVPIVDLTESAEGSSLRADIQTALDTASTAFSINNATNTVLVNTTGFFRVFGTFTQKIAGSVLSSNFNLFDGTTANNVYGVSTINDSNPHDFGLSYDFVVFLKAGVSLRATANSNAFLVGSTRQIADVSGNLVNPQGFV